MLERECIGGNSRVSAWSNRSSPRNEFSYSPRQRHKGLGHRRESNLPWGSGVREPNLRGSDDS